MQIHCVVWCLDYTDETYCLEQSAEENKDAPEKNKHDYDDSNKSGEENKHDYVNSKSHKESSLIINWVELDEADMPQGNRSNWNIFKKRPKIKLTHPNAQNFHF